VEVNLGRLLGGARCVREIPAIATLRLPELDSGMVGLVLEENPDAITVVEKEFPISYRSGYAPTITVEGEDASVHYLWNRLPDEGVKLPGGRTVSVTVKFGYYDSFAETDVPTLKKKVREYLNGKQWSSWSKPEILIPDLSVEGAIVPEIVTAEYGRCIIDGTPLLAYGTVIVNGNRYYTTDPYFKGEWYRNLDGATASRQKVEGKIESVRSELREQQERAAAKQEAEAAKAKVSALYNQHGSSYGSILESDLRSRLYNRAYSYLPSTSAELKAWTAESEALCAEVEAALVEAQLAKEQEEARREAARLEAARLYEEEQERAEAARLEEFEREKAEYAFLPEHLRDMAIGDLRTVKAFAEACRGIAGDRAASILECELNAPYGRARRQDGLRRQLPGLEETEAGQHVLWLSQAYRLDPMLEAAVAWLNASATVPEQGSEAPGQESADLDESLAKLANRWGANIRRK